MNKTALGFKFKHKDKNCQLDIMDWECNSPPLGYLWIRELKMIPVLPGLDPIEGMGEVIGTIHIQTGQIFDAKRITDFNPYVPSMPESAKLVYEMYFPHVSLWQKFLNIFRRKK